ncbi:unnamed protein product [Chrysodeixis includens]|uniref:Uncharacterized protein n=1 Tax=Chrysodeixis includens TaxID=689277 RepID=A0A9N8PYA6_CHRIL|nr:unnamed protein product [Chrysodeixis includens]
MAISYISRSDGTIPLFCLAGARHQGCHQLSATQCTGAASRPLATLSHNSCRSLHCHTPQFTDLHSTVHHHFSHCLRPYLEGSKMYFRDSFLRLTCGSTLNFATNESRAN